MRTSEPRKPSGAGHSHTTGGVSNLADGPAGDRTLSGQGRDEGQLVAAEYQRLAEFDRPAAG